MPVSTMAKALTKAAAECCRVAGCHQPRQGLYLWCRDHANKGRMYGHPLAQPIKPKSWAGQKALVRDLLVTNKDHPGVIQARQWVSHWVARAVDHSGAYKGAEEIARLHRSGITGPDILAEVAAFYAWLHVNPRALPDDRSRDVAISRAVFALAPRVRRATRSGTRTAWLSVKRPQSYSPKPRGSALLHVGRHLRESLAPFLANVAHSIETLDQRKAEAKAAMQAPLVPPVAL